MAVTPSVIVDVPATGFSMEAAKRAAYVLMARTGVGFEDLGTVLRCTLIPAVDAGDDQVAQLEIDFRRELLDQELRLSLNAETEPLRNAILGLAFSRTGLQSE